MIEQIEELEEMLEFLDYLRETGSVNMYGAVPYLRREFPPITDKQAQEVLLHWMDTFSERHPL